METSLISPYLVEPSVGITLGVGGNRREHLPPVGLLIHGISLDSPIRLSDAPQHTAASSGQLISGAALRFGRHGAASPSIQCVDLAVSSVCCQSTPATSSGSLWRLQRASNQVAQVAAFSA